MLTKWRWSAPAEKLITTNCQKSFSKFKLVLHVPAKKFKEIVKINIDPHKILDNFCLMKNYLEECLSHHNMYVHPCYLVQLGTSANLLSLQLMVNGYEVYDKRFLYILFGDHNSP